MTTRNQQSLKIFRRLCLSASAVMSLSPTSAAGFHHRHALALTFLRWQQKRGIGRLKVAKQMRKEVELRKSLARRAYEFVEAPLPWPVEPREPYLYRRLPSFPVPIIPVQENQHYREKPAYTFNQSVRLQEGVSQAMWLTKSVLMEENQMPKSLQQLANNLEFPDIEERVHQSIRSCRIYDTAEKMIKKKRISFNQTMSLIKLCGLLGLPDLYQRPLARGYYIATAWNRGEDEILVRGRPGILMSSRSPLPALATEEEVQSTVQASMPSFYPLSPMIDLWKHKIAKKNYNFPGFTDLTPFPHAHTLFIFNHEWKIPHTISQGIVFAFGNAICRAKLMHGPEYSSDLTEPIVTQAIVTNGVRFSFIHVQLNTLNMVNDDGVKNMVWTDVLNFLYQDNYPQNFKIRNTRGIKSTKREIVRKNKRRDPEVGCQNLDVGVFKKFLACIANGAT